MKQYINNILTKILTLTLLLLAGANVAWGQPFTVTTDPSHPNYYLLQNVGTPSFYAVPYTDDDEAFISTANVPNSDMRFYFMKAKKLEEEVEVEENGFYYIIHCSGKYLYAKGDANADGGARLKASATTPIDDRYKFSIVQNGDGYYIINKLHGSSAPLCKRGGNTGIGPDGTNTKKNFLKMNTYTPVDDYFRWNFIPISDTTPVTWTAPFTLSTDESRSYYKIKNSVDTGYFLSRNESTVNTSNTNSNELVWYFKEVPVGENGSDTYITYYYIIHALTGKYMCFDGDPTKYTQNQEGVVSIQDKTTVNEENCQFIVVRSSQKIGNDKKIYYNFIPKALKSFIWNNQSLDKKSGAITVRTATDRSGDTNRARWEFGDPIEYTNVCATPVISYDNSTGLVTITSDPADAAIHYTIDGTTIPSSSVGSLYSAPFSITDETTIKAIATKDGVTSSLMATATITKVAQPNLLNDGTNIVMSCSTDEADIYYSTDGGTTYTKYSSPLVASTYEGTTIMVKATKDGYIDSETESLIVKATCQMPTISLNYQTGEVTIESATVGTTIYYRIDGNDPDPNQVDGDYPTKTFSTPFTISTTTTIKAIAVKLNDDTYDNSVVVTESYSQVAMPSIQNNGSNAISMACTTEGAEIHYAIGGTAPTYGSSTYSTPLTENVSGQTIKAVAFKTGMVPSAIAENTISLQCNKPVITKGETKITISCDYPTSGVTIYYSDDGTNPSTVYPEGGITIEQYGITIRAIARATNYEDSEEASKLIMQNLDGSGTVADPFIIRAGEFGKFVTTVSEEPNAYYKLVANVEATSDEITTPFTGTFEAGYDNSKTSENYGCYYSISGLTHPLFNTINGGTVKNIMLKDVKIAQDGPVGAIAGIAEGYSRIYNCGILPTNNQYIAKDETSFVKSSGGDNSYCGGIVGWLKDDSRVINCFSYANVTGGSEVAGIVGYNSFASNTTKTNSNANYGNLRTMVMNCMFYGDITGGSTKHPVYGGLKIDNNVAEGINNYNYYRANRYEYNKEKDKYEDIDDVTFDAGFEIDNYFCSWPAEAEYLTRFEYYRSILNGNRPLAGWWVKSDVAPSTLTTAAVQAIEKDATLMAKWVLDPKIATYPILKHLDKYPSIVNPDQDKVWNAESNDWIDRKTAAKPYEGKILGSVEVTIKGGDFNNSKTESLTLQVLDMDTLNHDYCYAKVQLPYYNKVFGNPNGDTWEKKYASNYTTKVVTGWNITSATGTGATAGSFKGAASIKGTTNSTNSTPDDTSGKPWEDGYNFADRNCTNKDLFQKSGRVFAQGGYYYVPVGVTKITIEAHWAAARYVCNANNSYDRIMVGATHFEPAGKIPTTFQGQKVWTSIKDAIQNTDANAQTFSNVGAGITVYDQAIVLIGNMQLQNKSTIVGNTGDAAIPFTLMSADFDFDNEPDYCLDLQFRKEVDRPGVQPIRFDFLPVPDLGLAVKVDKYGYSIGLMVPFGHFEITETAFMHTTQFEYDGPTKGDNKMLAPLILNGGHFEQIVMRYGGRKTEYILMGGHFRMSRFTPGSHTNNDSQKNTRHCAVNAIGGEYPEFYLSGYYRTDANPTADNPHCYINGGKFNKIAGAGVEKINGSVTFKIDHALIREFYGGGINAANYISGSINVTIDNSHVDKYCGGPQVGDMSPNTTITTIATGTTFREFYGGGNGGTSYFRHQQTDGDTTMPTQQSDWNGLSAFSPLGKYDAGMGYHALYEFELFNSSNGLNDNVVKRAYYQWARFAKTQTGSITNTLTNCILLGNFYGGGNLAAVGGTTESNVDLGNCSVVSTLTNTSVAGSAYGGGYSASIPSFLVHDKSTVQIPKRDDAGIITEGEIDYQKDNDTTNDGSIYKYYRWAHSNDDLPEGVTLPSNVGLPTTTGKTATFMGSDGKYYCYTDQELTRLGTVTGLTSLTINGTSTIEGSVYGGGDESLVTGNTTVTLAGNAEVLGDVFGGGNNGEVGGTATVNIQPTIE